MSAYKSLHISYGRLAFRHGIHFFVGETDVLREYHANTHLIRTWFNCKVNMHGVYQTVWFIIIA